jgi:hypothetical protein
LNLQFGDFSNHSKKVYVFSPYMYE